MENDYTECATGLRTLAKRCELGDAGGSRTTVEERSGHLGQRDNKIESNMGICTWHAQHLEATFMWMQLRRVFMYTNLRDNSVSFQVATVSMEHFHVGQNG